MQATPSRRGAWLQAGGRTHGECAAIRSGSTRLAQLLFSAWLAAWVPQAMAADAQLDGARSLLEHGRYQDAYAMLSAPQMQAMPSGTEFDLLLARAALETGNTAQAKAP